MRAASEKPAYCRMLFSIPLHMIEGLPPAACTDFESLLTASVEEPGGIYRDMFCLLRAFSGQLSLICLRIVTGFRC